MKLSEFDFDLDPGLIAVRPVVPRSASRLLVAQGDQIADRYVSDLCDLLRKGDRLILNDTKVIPARLTGQRTRHSDQGETTARIELTLLTQLKNGDWQALAKPLKRLRAGEAIQFAPDFTAQVVAIKDGKVHLRFNQQGDDFDAALRQTGSMPLPPYIAALRPVDARDDRDYQTVFARRSGAVAAPTASLHFDDALLAQLADRGVDFSFVTLHVGAGTFLPVKVDDVSLHKMHREWGEVSKQAAQEINQTLLNGDRIIAVGTTALRLLETAATGRHRIAPWVGDTDIFITPGFQFQVVTGLMTNFHLPKSTLMMLVSALMGRATIRAIYDHAIKARYRFFSYGDSSLLLPENENDARRSF